MSAEFDSAPSDANLSHKMQQANLTDCNRRFLALGGGDGWHANELRTAAVKAGCDLVIAPYETLAANISCSGLPDLRCDAGSLSDFDAVLTRTMPHGSLERITFRLSVLHAWADQHLPIVNSPRGLEIAIDKFATLQRVASLGYQVPETHVVQSRAEAMRAFNEFGSDCVVKPLFGGEGRGVMRIRDPELAWYSFASLNQLDAVLYVQKFISPGGRDTRILLIGNTAIGLRRESQDDFRTNVTRGASCRQIKLTNEQIEMARNIARSIGISFASVDIIDSDDGVPRVVEVNGVPGWRGAQAAVDFSIADHIIKLLLQSVAESKSRARIS